MFRFYILLLIIGLVFSCRSGYNEIDASLFNEKIKDSVFSSPEKLIKAFYRAQAYDKISIESKSLANNKFQIILIHNNMEDDSISDLKIEMLAENSNGKWKVLNIKESWKCHSGRGFSGWGNSPCE